MLIFDPSPTTRRQQKADTLFSLRELARKAAAKQARQENRRSYSELEAVKVIRALCSTADAAISVRVRLLSLCGCCLCAAAAAVPVRVRLLCQ